MLKLLRIILGLALSIWLGALVMTLLAVTTLFARFPRATGSTVAVEGAPAVFAAFEESMRWVALAALLLSALYALASRRKFAFIFPLITTAIATAMLFVSVVFITPKLNQLRVEDKSQSPEFRQGHSTSNVLYLIQLAGVAVSLTVLLASGNISSKPQKEL